MEEIWKIVPFAPDYEVSNKGRVRSNRGRYKNHIMSLQTNKKGYQFVLLRTPSNERRFYQVHRLVMLTFCPIENSNDLEVNHKDENKTNNNLENLEWITGLENKRYGTAIERSHQKQRMKILCVETNIIYNSMAEASQQTGINYGNISSCCNGRLLTAGDFHWKILSV